MSSKSKKRPKMPSKAKKRQKVSSMATEERDLLNRLKVSLEAIDRQVCKYFYRGKPYQAKSVVVPNDIQLADHVVHKEFLDYLKGGQRRETGGESEVESGSTSAVYPYGQVEHVYASGKKNILPVKGPANWDHLWTDLASVGEEYRSDIPHNLPLLPQHMEYLRSLDQLKEPESKVSNITFIRKLGSGGFGAVWEISGWLEGKPIRLACKVIRIDPNLFESYSPVPPYAMSYERPVDFKDILESCQSYNILGDMLSLRYLKHRHICQMIDSLNIADTRTGFPFAVYLVFMELCDGDLNRLVKSYPNRRLSEQQSKHWFKQIAGAVGFLHMNNVVHMDTKLANILYMITNPFVDTVFGSTFKLGDFGLAVNFAPDKVGVVSGKYAGTFDEAVIEDIQYLGMALMQSLLSPDVNEEMDNWNDFIDIDQTFVDHYRIGADMGDLIIRMRSSTPFSITQVLAHKWIQN